ncbi:CYB2 [Symbiodinium sp. KB8]|nr:CYB2 [Symbiodinium sp. KB8]
MFKPRESVMMAGRASSREAQLQPVREKPDESGLGTMKTENTEHSVGGVESMSLLVPDQKGYTALPNREVRANSAGSVANSDTEAPNMRYRDTVRMDKSAEMGISLVEYRQKMASAKLVGALVYMDMGRVNVEPSSVYGAAILMPQVARTAGWPRSMARPVLQSYFYLYVCMLIHGALLCYIRKEQTVMDLFAGQMYLCDFGANLNACTVDPNAEGAWQTRSFVAASLKALFPDKADDIRSNVDPGEYGVESYNCRLLCCLVFVISIGQEAHNIMQMARLLYYVPSTDEPWYELGEEEEDEAQESMEKWLGQVTVQVAGMSRLWKIVNVILVLVPKFLLWEMTASTGVDFLMETAGIDDLIVNSVALGFLLTLDEMLTEAMMPHQVFHRLIGIGWGLELRTCWPWKTSGHPPEVCQGCFVNHLLGECNALRLYSNVDVEAHTDDEVLSKLQALEPSLPQLIWGLMPKSFFLAVGLTAFCVYRYYFLHCQLVDGQWVSKEMYLPKTLTMSVASAVLPSIFPVDAASEPYWSMP